MYIRILQKNNKIDDLRSCNCVPCSLRLLVQFKNVNNFKDTHIILQQCLQCWKKIVFLADIWHWELGSPLLRVTQFEGLLNTGTIIWIWIPLATCGTSTSGKKLLSTARGTFVVIQSYIWSPLYIIPLFLYPHPYLEYSPASQCPLVLSPYNHFPYHTYNQVGHQFISCSHTCLNCNGLNLWSTYGSFFVTEETPSLWLF